MKFIFFVLFMICFQNDFVLLDKEQISNLKERSYIVVRDSTGKILGSGADITPRPVSIYFDYFRFFPSTKEIEVKGGACSILTNTDTIYDKNLRVFKAINSNDTLYAIEYLHGGRAKVQSGKFHFKSSVDSIKHLYFVGGYTRVLEYKISKLLKLKLSVE